MLSEERLESSDVSVIKGEGVLRGAFGHAGGVRKAQGGDTGAGSNEHGVGVAVVAAGELHDDIATALRAGETQCSHHCFGAGVGEAHAIDGADAANDLLGKLDLGRARGAEGERVSNGALRGRDDCGVRVTEDGRAPGADEIDVVLALNVSDDRAMRAGHVRRSSADRTEGTHRRADATGDYLLGTCEPGCRTIGHGASLCRYLMSRATSVAQ